LFGKSNINAGGKQKEVDNEKSIGDEVYAGIGGGAYITVDWIKVGESFIGMWEPKIEEVRRI